MSSPERPPPISNPPSIRLLTAFQQLRPSIESRPSWRLALWLLPSVPELVPCPLPADRIGALAGPASGPAACA